MFCVKATDYTPGQNMSKMKILDYQNSNGQFVLPTKYYDLSGYYVFEALSNIKTTQQGDHITISCDDENYIYEITEKRLYKIIEGQCVKIPSEDTENPDYEEHLDNYNLVKNIIKVDIGFDV